MAHGNRGFADRFSSVAGGVQAPRLPPRTGMLDERGNRLAELASGNAVTRVHELVDPETCRIWEGHNRDYAALDEENCADLIESLKAQGRQEVAAIVRRLRGHPQHGFEVICGARRHWSVSWLRAHGRPELKFLIEPRELTDEEAFRLADLENRNRRDLSDYERAATTRAPSSFTMRVTSSAWPNAWKSARAGSAATWSLRACRSRCCTPSARRTRSASAMRPRWRPALRDSRPRARVLAAAEAVAAEQAERQASGQASLPPAHVMRRLLSKARNARTAEGPHEVRGPDGTVVARGERRGRGGGLAIQIPLPGRRSREELLAALTEFWTAWPRRPRLAPRCAAGDRAVRQSAFARHLAAATAL